MAEHKNSKDKREEDFSWLYAAQQKNDCKTKAYLGLQEKIRRWKPHFATLLICLLSFLLVVFWQPDTSQQLLSAYSAKPAPAAVQSGEKSDIIPIESWPEADSKAQNTAISAEAGKQKTVSSISSHSDATDGTALIYNDGLLKQCADHFMEAAIDAENVLLQGFEYRRDSHEWVKQIKAMEKNGDYAMANKEYSLLCSFAEQ